MPVMSENVPSGGADQGPERSNGAAQEAAALLRTAASALLSAADIWTTSNVARANAPVAPADAPAAEIKSQPEAMVPHRLRPSEVLAEAEFFRLQAKRPQDGLGAPAPLPSGTS